MNAFFNRTIKPLNDQLGRQLATKITVTYIEEAGKFERFRMDYKKGFELFYSTPGESAWGEAFNAKPF